MLAAAVALAASTVSISGSIVFLGLMASHITGKLFDPRHQLFLPVALLISGLLLLTANTIGRNALDADGIADGIMVSHLGALYFIYLLLIT